MNIQEYDEGKTLPVIEKDQRMDLILSEDRFIFDPDNKNFVANQAGNKEILTWLSQHF